MDGAAVAWSLLLAYVATGSSVIGGFYHYATCCCMMPPAMACPRWFWPCW